jgi:diguanylate cyclase (GGDEF)-like protein
MDIRRATRCCEIARRVQGVVRDVDRVARFGGEELAVTLVEQDAAAALAAAERVVAAVRGELVKAGDNFELAITTSAGVAAMPDHADNAADLVAAADAALHRAKREGRDRACLHVEKTKIAAKNSASS